MTEWSKVHDWKSCVRATVPGVRIPSSPPRLFGGRPLRRIKGSPPATLCMAAPSHLRFCSFRRQPATSLPVAGINGRSSHLRSAAFRPYIRFDFALRQSAACGAMGPSLGLGAGETSARFLPSE